MAPVNLVYVAHGERMTNVSAEERRLYASVDSGFIWPECLSILRLGRARQRRGRLRKAGSANAPA